MTNGLFKLVCWMLAFAASLQASAEAQVTQTRLREVTTVEGIRENPLVGYGIVVGLNGTGDKQQTIFSTQTLANMLQRVGLQVPGATIVVKNIAAVFVTAELPPFAHPGMQLDVTVSSIGDAKSLEGGVLVLTALRASNGQVYAEAQGALTLGGYSVSSAGSSKQVNHATVGRVPGGAIIEQGLSIDLHSMKKLTLLLRDPDFMTAQSVAETINIHSGRPLAHAIDSRTVDVDVSASASDAMDLLAHIEDLPVNIRQSGKVVVNERTGTIVLGQEVTIGAVSIMHGSLEIEIVRQELVSQPGPLSNGTTTVVPQITLKAQDAPVKRIELKEGATVEDLIRGLESIGATSRDVITILQAIQQAGALHADLVVL